MWYVERQNKGYSETVDEFDTVAEALEMATEYTISDPAARFLVTDKPTDGWED
ncbi:hypothetical protein LCGC14_0344410 [marine sediment metagenome]|uniref:Uncharacterized protein n=1 Tax=marine sediment metagenome TaxID=412755 RepID=A0A0F9TCJ9_9ZZZZ